MITCKECKYWSRGRGYGTIYHPLTKNYGNCASAAFAYSQEFEPSDRVDMLLYSDYEGYNAGFSTGEDFGCIHGERDED